MENARVLKLRRHETKAEHFEVHPDCRGLADELQLKHFHMREDYTVGTYSLCYVINRATARECDVLIPAEPPLPKAWTPQF